MFGDGQGRSKSLGTKAPNNWSKHPCAYCMITDGLSELDALADVPHEQDRRSRDLRLVPPDASGLPLPLYIAMRIVPTENVPVEGHTLTTSKDAKNSKMIRRPQEVRSSDGCTSGQSQLCQVFFLEMLSDSGRRLVSAIMAQKPSLLYPPGTRKLKDVVTNYVSVNGSDKWTLQSIMLLVFRMVLQDVLAMGDTSALICAVMTPGHDAYLAEEKHEDKGDQRPRHGVGNVRQSLGGAAAAYETVVSPVVRRPRAIFHRTGATATRQNSRVTRYEYARTPARVNTPTRRTSLEGGWTAVGGLHCTWLSGRTSTAHSWLLSNGLPYRVTRNNRQNRTHEIITVQSGDGCVRLMQSLASFLGHDHVPTDIHAEADQTPAELSGQYPGSAVWTASLFNNRDEQQLDREWRTRLASSKFRQDEQTLLRAYRAYCGHSMAGPCSSSRCPDCWDGDTLQQVSIDCSRYTPVPMVASCGLGRLKGGDVKSAAQAGPRDEWALGSGGGDNVEVYKQLSPMPAAGRVDPTDLALVKILYFFRHEGNRPVMGGNPPPLTWWVLGCGYNGVAHANDCVPDSITGHPTLNLRARGRPAVYPVSSNYRQVHLYHACSLSGEGEAGSSHV
ncbi:unnamed protein product [Ectocarpus sp. CCAP 1310/34]|nr:unnamed protein product [Ectocarpus sp. CCAP 1310/34]